MGCEIMDFILKWLDVVGFRPFVGVALKQLLNVLDKLGYRKILDNNSAPSPPRSLTFPTGRHVTVPLLSPTFT